MTNQINTNKQLIVKCYQSLFGQQNIEMAKSLISDDYIQHNPMVKDGKEGFIEFLEFLKTMPTPKTTTTPFMRIIANENLVVVHSKVFYQGSYRATVDMYRIANNQLAEHWDASEIIPDSIDSDIPMVEGTTEFDQSSSTQKNIETVTNYITQVYVNKKRELAKKYLSSKVVFHTPGLENGYPALVQSLTEIQNTQMYQTVGEKNFVVVQLKHTYTSSEEVEYLLFRLEQNQIIEQWSVAQEIPNQMMHDNGML